MTLHLSKNNGARSVERSAPIDRIEVGAYTIPTDSPESDGTLEWDETTAPGVHAHLCCAAARAKNLEYFHDHVRIERLLFDGIAMPADGALRPDRSRPGLGLELKRADAEPYRS